jgi:hypothetical protein
MAKVTYDKEITALLVIGAETGLRVFSRLALPWVILQLDHFDHRATLPAAFALE